MVRPLSPFDLVRSVLSGYLNTGNRAFTLDHIGQFTRPSVRVLMEVSELATTLCRSSRICLVDIEEDTDTSIVALRCRPGLKNWEVTHLYLQGDETSNLSSLLDQVGVSCLSYGAERVFLRLRRDELLFQECQRGGFFPCHNERLYIGRHKNNKEYATTGIRPRESADEFPLFQLHNMSTPSNIRHVTGMTFEQWRSSQETYMGRVEQYVFERDGIIRGCMEARLRLNSGQISLLVHPGEEATIHLLIRFILNRMRGVKDVACLVPEYDTNLKRALENEGFENGPEFTILVNSMTSSVRREATQRSMSAIYPL